MRIIFSPTKTMQRSAAPEFAGLPVYLNESEMLLARLRSLSAQELKKLWGCSDDILEENIKRLEGMDLKTELTAAVSAFEGIAFKYLSPETLDKESLMYLQKNLRILSGFYGVLKPLDGIRPYRLDMENRLSGQNYKNLYEFWGGKIYDRLRDDSGVIINLASKEYAKCVEKYLQPDERFITCNFAEMVKGELKQKATFSKMARGEMLRYMAENKIEDPEELKGFNRLGFKFRHDLSDKDEFVFERTV